jgi:hypothetical protein
MEYLSFEVADFKSSYHAILGRSMLASFGAIPHYTYLVLKMPTPNGILTFYSDLIVSFRCDNEALEIARRMPASTPQQSWLLKLRRLPRPTLPSRSRSSPKRPSMPCR